MSKLPVVLAITGASGAPYAVRLLEVLATHAVPTWLLVSAHGWRLLEEECGIEGEPALRKATGSDWHSVQVFDDKDRGAAPASGSARTGGMVVFNVEVTNQKAEVIQRGKWSVLVRGMKAQE